MSMLPKNINPITMTQPAEVPTSLPRGLRDFLNKVRNLPTIRDTNLSTLEIEYFGEEPTIIERYRPDNIDDSFWNITKSLMLHMNTTRIAIRSLEGVYSGGQTRRVEGTGDYVEALNAYANSSIYREAVPIHFTNAVLFGTSAATPTWDDETDQMETVLHDPVRTRLYARPSSVKSLLALVEHDRHGRFVRFVTREGSGEIYAPDLGEEPRVALYNPGLPYLLSSVAYGEDRRAYGNVYGASLVRQTVGYNRILTNCYYFLGLLIKWQAKAMLVIMAGEKGGADAMPKKIATVAGSPTMLLDKDSVAKFLSPDAKFHEVLEVIDSYLQFLAVSLGIPKTVFQPQDNMSAESAKLEGAPLVAQMRKLANQFEEYEKDLLLRHAAFLHVRAGEMKTIAELRREYDFVVRLKPWNYSDDIYRNSAAMIALVNAGIMRLRDAIKEANPEIPDEEVEQLIAEQQERVARDMEKEMSIAAGSGDGGDPVVNQ